jgi:hypothetical protein
VRSDELVTHRVRLDPRSFRRPITPLDDERHAMPPSSTPPWEPLSSPAEACRAASSSS